MVSVQQLQSQQQQLRQIRSGLSLQQQQAQLRSGLTPRQFIRREEEKIRAKAQSQITTELKSQGSNIDNILKDVNSISQFRELINQVPPELRQFIKTTEASLQQDLQNRIQSVEAKINNREKAIIEKVESRKSALEDDNQSQAERFEAERRGIEVERDFLKFVALPRLRQGELLPVLQIFSIATRAGTAEEDKRRALDREFNKISQKLEGGRKELSGILRTQKITQTQAIQLGLLPAQVPIQGGLGGIEISKEFLPPPTELLPGQVTQVPGVQPLLITEKERIELEKSQRRLTKEEFEKLSFIEKGFIGFERQPLPDITLEERAGIFTPFVKAGGLGEIVFPAIEKLGEIIPKAFPETAPTRAFLEAEVPFVSRQEAIELLDLVIKFQIFSPLLTTGATAKAKQAAKQKARTQQVKKADKKTIQKVVDLLEDSFKRGELKNELIKFSDSIIRDTNPITKSIKIENMNSILDEALRRGFIRNFFIDPKTGAIAFTDNVGTLFRVGTRLAPEIELQIEAILFESPQIPTQALAITGAGVGFGEGKIPPFKDLGKIGALDLGKIEGLGELGKIQALDLGDIDKLKKEQQKNFQKLFEGVLTTTKQTAKQKAEEKARQKELAKLRTTQIQFPGQITDIIFDIPIPIPTIQIPEITFEDPFPIPKFPIPKFPIPRPPTKPPKKPTKIIPFGFPFPDKELRLMKLPKFDEGFDLFLKEKGRRIKRESNINMEDVLDIGSFLADNSTSREFSFKETGKKAKPPKTRVPEDYWEINRSKFRNFKIQQGQFKPLKNAFIEKTDFAIDSPGEVQQLSVARFLAQQRKQNREMDRMAKQLSRGFNNPKPQRQLKQNFKQVDISKTINFNTFMNQKRKRKKEK